MASNKSSKLSKCSRNGVVAVKLKKPLRRCCNLSKATIRKLVYKEVKKQLQKILHPVNSLADLESPSESLPDQAEPSLITRLQLHFVSKLPTKLFTASKVYAIADETETNTRLPVKVVLLDENNHVVNEGPLSSLKVEILVACGSSETEEFEPRLVVARQEIGSLLVGNCVKTMENGVCCFNDLKFVDNSSWMPSKMFKLVAKVSESAELPSTVEIQQGLTGPFRVKDQRGKFNEKRVIPSMDDEVRRLEKVGEKYSEKLKAAGIFSVKDFLQKYYIDESSLKKVLGVKKGLWETIVQHTTKCIPNGEYFGYKSEDQEQIDVELLFNCFYKLIGVSFDHQNCHSFETLTEYNKSRVEQVRRRAFEPENKLVQINYPPNWPTQQDQAMQDKDVMLENIQSYPQSPLLQNDDEEEQYVARMRNISSILRSNTLLRDTLIIDNENHPLYMQDLGVFDGRSSNWRPTVWYRARVAVLWFLSNKTRMIIAGP